MSLRALLPLLLLTACAAPADEPAPQPAAPAAPAPQLSQPVEWPGIARLFQQGDAYFASQPTAAGLRHAAAQGVKTVINMRDDDLSDVGYDEPALAKELGLTYRRVPVNGRTFTRADVAAFGKLLAEAKRPVLIHCRSSNRIGGLWASHLVGEGRIPLDAALEHGKAAGLKAPPTIERTRQISAELKATRDAQ